MFWRNVPFAKEGPNAGRCKSQIEMDIYCEAGEPELVASVFLSLPDDLKAF